MALKLSCTYPAEGPFEDEEDEADETFTIGLEANKDDEDEYEPGAPHNIFYLEGVFLRLES